MVDIICPAPARTAVVSSLAACSPAARRILERLEIEHLRHGAQNNGELFVSFGQFVDYGVSRRSDPSHVDSLAKLWGFCRSPGPTRTASDIRPPNAYRLTYVPAKGAGAPTDEWKSVSDERAQRLVAAIQEGGKGRGDRDQKGGGIMFKHKQLPSSLSCMVSVPFPARKRVLSVPFPVSAQ